MKRTRTARKIVILAALASGKLVSVDKIHAEGITNIRKSDVLAAEKIGYSIKLLGRCINTEDSPYIFVAPFMLSSDSALAGVCGVYNAVEVVGEPIGNVMFYGKGAGAGATASAVVGDLMQTMNYGELGAPIFEKCDNVRDFDSFTSKHYLAFEKGAEATVKNVFEKLSLIDGEDCAFVSEFLSEADIKEKIGKVETLGCKLLSHIRVL